ncbi:MAG: glycosyltransferase family 39 protein [Candidatus Aminicenantes bacterium]|nr:MAG: glycosyltransferase family 39 protein [Candidatus Aminicenantes bacterium]
MIKTWRLKKVEIIVAVFILLFSMGLRINAPRADLPSHITFSGSILTDEGNQCHNSRSKTLYDQWYPDDWRITNYNPILPWIKYGIFKIFGVGLLQMRLVNYLFAGLSLLFFFLTLKSYFQQNFKFALLGTLLLGFNFLYVMYNKIGTFETSIIFWVILTLYFLEKYRGERKSIFLILAGASTFMTFIFKSIMAYALPLPFVAYILVYLFNKPDEEKISIKKGILNIFFILLGILILFIPWYLFHYLPNKEWIISAPGQYMENLMFPGSLEKAFRNFLAFPWKNQFYKMPIVWLSAILYVPLFFRRLLRKEAKMTEIGYTLFFFAHTAVFLIMSYRPTRYFIPVIPAMVFMTVVLWQRWASISSSPEKPVSYGYIEKSVIFIVDILWLSLAAYFCLIPLFTRYFLSIPRPPFSIFYFIVSAILVAVVYLIKSLYRQYVWKPLKPKYLLIPLIVLMIVVSLVINMSYYWQWNADKTYVIRDISRELGEKLEDAYIGGMTSTVAVMENRHKALWLYPDFVNWDAHTFEKYPLTHALLGTDVSKEIIHFFNQWPERMKRAKLLTVYPLKNYFLHLYSFVGPYISHCTIENGQKYRLKVVNPSKRLVKTRVGEVYYFKKKPGEKSQEPAFRVYKGQQVFTLAPGENEMVILVKEPPGSNAASLLFYLDYPHPFGKDKLRYEGENFPGKIGFNKRDRSASHGYTRYFDRARQVPGFLSYGPAVPYARGFLIADFKLKFANLKTKLRPICRLDIYSYQDNGPVAEGVIKPADIKKNKTHIYRLYTIIPGTKKLEFRIQTEKWADISFDYIDVTYYQGYVVNF